MIWIVTTESERNSLIPDRKLSIIKATLGDVERIIYEGPEDLGIIAPDDVVLVETKQYHILEAIAETGAIHTGESWQAIKFDEDKILLKSVLRPYGIKTPDTYSLHDSFPDDRKYFVKPLILEDSIGIDKNSLCYTRREVLRKAAEIREKYNFGSIVEEFIDGYDCTVAVFRHNGRIESLPIIISPNSECNFLSYDVKTKDTETYRKEVSEIVRHTAIKVFNAIGAENYARIDMRVGQDGAPYVLEVNLYPGLSNTGYMYRCFELHEAASYPEMLNMILGTARRTKTEE